MTLKTPSAVRASPPRRPNIRIKILQRNFIYTYYALQILNRKIFLLTVQIPEAEEIPPGSTLLVPMITNKACVYPKGGGLSECIWSNAVVNAAHSIYLPLLFSEYFKHIVLNGSREEKQEILTCVKRPLYRHNKSIYVNPIP